MDIYEDISRALGYWLSEISFQESRFEKLEKTLQRTVLQTKYEGLLSLTETNDMEQSAQLWLKLLKTLQNGNKEEVLDAILSLFYLGHLSMHIAKIIIMKI